MRLLPVLNNTQLAQKDNPLYQFLKDLLTQLSGIANIAGSSSGSGSGSNITNIINNPISFLGNSGENDNNSYDSYTPIPGPKGDSGSQGFSIRGLQGEDGESPLIIPGSQGIQGVQGLLGIPGRDGEDSNSSFISLSQPPPGYAIIDFTSTGTINDYNPGNSSPLLWVRCNNASAAVISGIVANSGQTIVFQSVNADVSFSHQSSGSSAINRLVNFITSANTPILLGTATFQYDLFSNRWRLSNHIQGKPITYTVIWTGSVSNPVLNDGTLAAHFLFVGNLVWVQIELVTGSLTTYGSGTWAFSLPATLGGSLTLVTYLGFVFNAGSGLQYAAFTSFAGSVTSFVLIDILTGSPVSSTVPFAWSVAGSVLTASGLFQGL